MQGKDASIIQFKDILKSFVEQLTNWSRKIAEDNVQMFYKLSSTLETKNLDFNEDFKTLIVDHLSHLKLETTTYFRDLDNVQLTPIRNPFSANLDVPDIPDNLQDEYIDMKNVHSPKRSSAKNL